MPARQILLLHRQSDESSAGVVRVTPCIDWLRLRTCGEMRTLPFGLGAALSRREANCDLSLTLIAAPLPPPETTDLPCFVAARAVVGLSNGGWPPKGWVVAPGPPKVPRVVPFPPE